MYSRILHFGCHKVPYKIQSPESYSSHQPHSNLWSKQENQDEHIWGAKLSVLLSLVWS